MTTTGSAAAVASAGNAHLNGDTLASTLSGLCDLAAEEDVILVRPLADNAQGRELRINCPDELGLGCDITRVLLDFGLRILQGDMSTDGSWCLLVFKVLPVRGTMPVWSLLKSRLETLCAPANAWAVLQRRQSSSMFQAPSNQSAFLLQIVCSDRMGVLHDLMQTLWDLELVVFKAQISTTAAQDVLDLFWICDSKELLPDNHRSMAICDRVRSLLGQRCSSCSISSVPIGLSDSNTAFVRRSACKDVRQSTIGMRGRTRAKKRAQQAALVTSGEGSRRTDSEVQDSCAEEDAVKIVLDNESSRSHTLVSLECRDRKGLVYDIMRTLHDANTRVACGTLSVKGELAYMELFVQDADRQPVIDREVLADLHDALRTAVALPVRIRVRDVFDGICTELLVTTFIDVGGRGRPRVTYDVTAALNSLQLCVFQADVFWVTDAQLAADDKILGLHGSKAGSSAASLAVPPRQLLEVHRFLVHFSDGHPVKGEKQKRHLYECVRTFLSGN